MWAVLPEPLFPKKTTGRASWYERCTTSHSIVAIMLFSFQNIIRKVSGQKFVYKFVSYPELSSMEGVKDEGGTKRLEQVQSEAKMGDGPFGSPKAPRGGGGAPRSSRNEYMRSGLYSTFTIQSLQTPSPAGRASRHEAEPLAVVPPPAVPAPDLPLPSLAPVEDLPQLHISIEEPEELQETLQVRHTRSVNKAQWKDVVFQR